MKNNYVSYLLPERHTVWGKLRNYLFRLIHSYVVETEKDKYGIRVKLH